MKCAGNCLLSGCKCPNLVNAKGYFCTKFQNWIKDMINCDYKRNQLTTFKKVKRNIKD